MIRRRKLKLYAVAEVAVLITLAIASTTVAGQNNPPPNAFQLKERILIDVLEIYLFEDPFFEAGTRVRNHVSYPMYFKITHILMYPNGEEEQQSWYEGILEGGQFMDSFIFCMYITDQFGKYTWVATVTDENGALLDQKSVTWERIPIPSLSLSE